MKKWYVYIVTCSDGTYYTGITTNVDNRIATHNSGKGAKYTKARLPVKLETYWEFENKSLASKEEYIIKQFPKRKKYYLIIQNEGIKLIDDHLEYCKYKGIWYLNNSGVPQNPNYYACSIQKNKRLDNLLLFSQREDKLNKIIND